MAGSGPDGRLTIRPLTPRRAGDVKTIARGTVSLGPRSDYARLEGHPRAKGPRVHDDLAIIGAEPMFRKAGFRRVRGVLPGLPRGWTPRVTMRATCTSRSTA